MMLGDMLGEWIMPEGVEEEPDAVGRVGVLGCEGDPGCRLACRRSGTP